MKNKKLPLLALGMLLIGAGASIAYQSHAAQIVPPVAVQAAATDQTDQTVDQKDANGKDIETADDNKAVVGAEKESANDNDSDAQSEQNEADSGQTETAD
jgi:hypothetical protein